MFTGIVEELGEVAHVEDLGEAVRLTVRGPVVVSDARAGDSIAVDGCCLTVVATGPAGGEPQTFTADVMKETLSRTGLGGLREGTRVNLERAVAVGDRMGGHLVQGHVDGTGEILRRAPSEHWELMEISAPDGLDRYLVEKGSVTVDGVSLTVVDVGAGRFTVSLVPETLRRTTLGGKQAGAPVNLEVDVIAKYVERLVAPHVGRPA